MRRTAPRPPPCPIASPSAIARSFRLQPFAAGIVMRCFSRMRANRSISTTSAHVYSGGASVADPRVTHSMTLEVDAYGNELKSAAIAYGRRYADPDPLLTAADRAIQARHTHHLHRDGPTPMPYRLPTPIARRFRPR